MRKKPSTQLDSIPWHLVYEACPQLLYYNCFHRTCILCILAKAICNKLDCFSSLSLGKVSLSGITVLWSKLNFWRMNYLNKFIVLLLNCTSYIMLHYQYNLMFFWAVAELLLKILQESERKLPNSFWVLVLSSEYFAPSVHINLALQSFSDTRSVLGTLGPNTDKEGRPPTGLSLETSWSWGLWSTGVLQHL